MLKKLLLMLFLGVFCTTVFAESVHIEGSSTCLPLLKKAARKLKKQGLELTVLGGGSSTGVKKAAKGEVDLGAASRGLKDKEKKAYPTLKMHTIANDGIAILVHASNPIKEITKQQIQDIYTGKITKWSQLGGSNTAIEPEMKTSRHGTQDLFLKHFGLKNKVKTGFKEYDSMTEALGFISGNPNAIGFLSVGLADASIKRRLKIKKLKLDGVSPTVANIQKEKYSLRRGLYLISNGKPNPSAAKLIKWFSSSEGKKTVERQGFIPN